MENILLEAASAQGIWVIMFVVLLIYTIKNNEKREANYQALLQSLSEKYDLLLDVKDNIEKIHRKVFEEK